MAQRNESPINTDCPPAETDDLVDNPDYLNSRFMLRMAVRIADDYRHLGIYLRMENYTLAAIEADNGTLVDRAFEVIKTWKYATANPKSYAAYSELTGALKDLGRNDLVDFVRGEAWKNAARSDQTANTIVQPTETERCLYEQIRQLEEGLKSMEQTLNEKLKLLSDQLMQAKEEGRLNELKSALEEETKSNTKTDNDDLRRERSEELRKTNQQITETKEEQLILLNEQLKRAKEEAKACEKRTDEEIQRLTQQINGLHKDLKSLVQLLSARDDKASKVAEQARPVNGETRDAKKMRMLKVMRLVQRNQDPQLWLQVSSNFVVDGVLDISGVLTAADLHDLEYILCSGQSRNITNLRVGGDWFGEGVVPVYAFGDMDAVRSLCRWITAMPQLRELGLCDCQITNDGFVIVCETIRTKCREMTWLFCPVNNRITSDIESHVVSTLKTLPKLTISLWGCSLSSECGARLAEQFGRRICFEN